MTLNRGAPLSLLGRRRTLGVLGQRRVIRLLRRGRTFVFRRFADCLRPTVDVVEVCVSHVGLLKKSGKKKTELALVSLCKIRE